MSLDSVLKRLTAAPAVLIMGWISITCCSHTGWAAVQPTTGQTRKTENEGSPLPLFRLRVPLGSPPLWRRLWCWAPMWWRLEATSRWRCWTLTSDPHRLLWAAGEPEQRAGPDPSEASPHQPGLSTWRPDAPGRGRPKSWAAPGATG